MTLQVGVLIPTREAVLANQTEAEGLLQFGARAEQAGFDSVWVGDSLLARPRHEPLTMLAALAARTRRVALGTAVLIGPLRNPVALGQAVATVDQIARGRLILGMGMASAGKDIEAEFLAAGADFPRRAGRLREMMRLMPELWRGGPVQFAGRYWTLDGARLQPLPYRTGGPPLWVGGSGPFSLKLAGELAAGWFPNSPSVQAFREGWQGVTHAADAAGRPHPVRALYTTITLDDNAARAQAEMKAFIERYYLASFDALVKRQGCASGSPSAVLESLAKFVAEGVEHLVLRFGSADQAGQLERAAKELLPQLRALGA
jgi:alkanesulfonate monooxygenase SsuD/methylene tetrahydromethanopterin reductase-like flavin-dependent oxidoreductase (luciferase family)